MAENVAVEVAENPYSTANKEDFLRRAWRQVLLAAMNAGSIVVSITVVVFNVSPFANTLAATGIALSAVGGTASLYTLKRLFEALPDWPS